MRINHNIAALNTYRQLTGNTGATSKSLEKLSSGMRINRAGDDAAGLAISEKMRGQIRGLNQASSNAQDGISLIQTAEGALNETHSILQRMRELAVQASTDTNTANDRAEIQKEIDQLATEITRISNDTEFNTQKLLNGGITSAGLGESTFQIGANANQKLTINVGAMDAKTLGVSRDTIGASVATGATDISGASISGTPGAAVVNGATISVSVADNTGNIAELTGKGLTITGGAAGAEYNGFTVTLGDNTTEEINVDYTAKTITINLDLTNGASNDISALTVNTTGGSAPAGGAFTFAGDASGLAAGDAGALAGTTTGGVAADPSQTIVTFSDGGSNSVDVVVADTATSVAGTGAFAGLSFTTDDVTSAAGDINVATQVASAATFNTTTGATTDAVTAAGIDVSTRTAANSAITQIDTAISTVSSERAKLGAYQNRLEHTINNLGTTSENLTASESRIRDVDMAKEMMEFTKNNILSQAAQAMLAQANQQPQSVLQLLQ